MNSGVKTTSVLVAEKYKDSIYILNIINFEFSIYKINKFKNIKNKISERP